MALGSTQPLTEMSTRSIRLTTLPSSCAVVMKCGYLNVLEPSGSIQSCNGTDLPLHVSAIFKHLQAHFSVRVCCVVHGNLLRGMVPDDSAYLKLHTPDSTNITYIYFVLLILQSNVIPKTCT